MLKNFIYFAENHNQDQNQNDNHQEEHENDDAYENGERIERGK